MIMKRCLVMVLCLIGLLFAGATKTVSGRADTAYGQLLVKATPDAAYVSTLPLSKTIFQGIKAAKVQASATVPVSDKYVQAGDKLYIVDDRYHLVESSGHSRLTLPAAAQLELQTGLKTLGTRHYGELADWSVMKDKLPRGATFSVVDLISGQEFRVQRRAGSGHADVQPLTRQDTATMKAIYDGKWSWKRRAILVRSGSATYAASMHGMPHGGDGIPDNDFKGHFCIHYLGSLTHKTDQQDPDHDVMVHKAGGQLARYVRSQPPAHLAELFLIALRQQDMELLAVLFQDRSKAVACAESAALRELSGIRIAGSAVATGDDGQPLTASATVSANAYRGSAPTRLTLELAFSRSAPGLPWMLETVAPQGRER